MKADLPKREPERQKRWETTDLYGRLRKARAGTPVFLLHDGPPYANGHIHLGHALNKVMKDLVVRSKGLAGFDAPYLPGWDCHGLPIELKVDYELGAKKREMTDAAVRKECRNYAEKWIDVQRKEFKRLGILGEWERPYRTMDREYQAQIARAFGAFVGKGLVTFGFKAVLWCVNCKTALAEAEVEYEEKTDPSIWLAMPLEEDSVRLIWGETGLFVPSRRNRFFALIWTTTPWTLPANRAISVGPDIQYVFLRRTNVSPDEWYLVALDRVDAVVSALGWDRGGVEVRDDLRRSGALLSRKLRYRRPFDMDGTSFGFLDGEHVSTSDGTGLVHTAPGHGREDYEVVRRHGFKVDDPALCPVDEAGYFIDAFVPPGLRALRVVSPKEPAQDASAAVCRALAPEAQEPSGSLLLREERVSHSYPHCWRCKKPVIFRATHQWFIDLGALRETALAEIHGSVRWIPAFGENRIGAMVENRLEWTISRQRRWGSPVTFLRCVRCAGKGVTSHFPSISPEVPPEEKAQRDDFFERVFRAFHEHGADAWYEERFPASFFLGESSVCSSCGGREFEKLRDILDVWFDSGVSHAAVLRSGDYADRTPDPAPSGAPVLYLEGHDQHRGWFQSSLLTSVALFGRAPYQSVITHGFTVDGEGRKMSKSLGNVVAPQDVMVRHGADVLRLWVAATDYTDDVRMNEEILQRTADAYRKVRNTAKFLLGNLFDFDPARHAVSDDRLERLDRWVLDTAARFAAEAQEAYARYEFHAVVRRLLDLVTTDLSAFWCDVRKDAFYVLAAADPVRRSAQTAAWRLVETIAIALSPICPFTAEEVWEAIPGRAADPSALFMTTWRDLTLPGISSDEREAWDRVVALRARFLQALEPLRRENQVGSAAQAEAVVGRAAGLDEALRTLSLSDEKLAEVLAVPSVVRDAGAEGVLVRPATGAKCPRCWQVRPDVEPDGVCSRCRRVLATLPPAA